MFRGIELFAETLPKLISYIPVTLFYFLMPTLISMVLGTLIYVKNRARITTKDIQHPAAGVCIGLALGICSSFLGIGGGPMNLAVLYYFFSMGTIRTLQLI